MLARGAARGQGGRDELQEWRDGAGGTLDSTRANPSGGLPDAAAPSIG